MRSVYDNISVINSIPQTNDSGGSAVNGAAVDTKGYNSAMAHFRNEAASGSPSASSIVWKLQESNSSGSGFGDALDNTGTVIGGTLDGTQINDVFARIEGLGTNRKRYLRVVETITFTGGTSPKNLVVGEIVLGRAFTKPVTSTVSNT